MPVSTDAQQYANVAELELYTLRTGFLPASVTDAMRNAQLLAASGIIDSYLVGRFELPLTEWGIDITQACTSIAGYFLGRRFGSNINSTDGANLRQGYDDAVGWLKHVSDGKATPSGVTLTDSATEKRSASAPFVVSVSGGSIGTSSGGFYEKDGDNSVSVGTVGAPKLRGW